MLRKFCSALQGTLTLSPVAVSSASLFLHSIRYLPLPLWSQAVAKSGRRLKTYLFGELARATQVWRYFPSCFRQNQWSKHQSAVSDIR